MEEEPNDIRSVVQAVIQEFVKAEQTRAEPAYKTELAEERKRRESLEHRVNELVAENQRTRAQAESDPWRNATHSGCRPNTDGRPRPPSCPDRRRLRSLWG